MSDCWICSRCSWVNKTSDPNCKACRGAAPTDVAAATVPHSVSQSYRPASAAYQPYTVTAQVISATSYTPSVPSAYSSASHTIATTPYYTSPAPSPYTPAPYTSSMQGAPPPARVPQYASSPAPASHDGSAYSAAAARPVPSIQSPTNQGSSSQGPPPKKFVRINGINKINPAYKAWQQSQGGGAATTATTTTAGSPKAPNQHQQALPVLSGEPSHQYSYQTATTLSPSVPRPQQDNGFVSGFANHTRGWRES